MKELERLNGRAFTMDGFAWDYSGTVTSWRKGRLERLSQACGGVGLRLGPGDAHPELQNKFAGDREFSSDLVGMQLLNPKVNWMAMGFFGCSAPMAK